MRSFAGWLYVGGFAVGLAACAGPPTVEISPTESFDFLQAAEYDEVVGDPQAAQTFKYNTDEPLPAVRAKVETELVEKGWDCEATDDTLVCTDPEPPSGLREHSAGVQTRPDGDVQIIVWEYY